MENNIGKALLKLGLILGAGYVCLSVIDELIGDEDDTVNYTLFHRGRKVYHGICYEDRVYARLNEHRRRGLRFDDHSVSKAKRRVKAMDLERNRIRRDGTMFNIQHNCD